MVLAILLAAAFVAAPAPAVAVPSEPFLLHFAKGEELLKQGDYGAAIWNLRRADQLKSTAATALQLARCHEKLGDRAYATYYHRLYLRRGAAPSEALGVAERIGAALTWAGNKGRGLLEVDAPMPGTVSLDGRPSTELPLAVLLAPGDYEVTVQFPAGAQKRQLSIRTGKVTSATFDPLPPPLVEAPLPPPAPAPVVAAVVAAPEPALAQVSAPPEAVAFAPAPPPARRWKRTGAYVALGISAAALVGGLAAGALARNDANRLVVEHDALTTPEARRLAGSANDKGRGANILWGVGGATALAGGALFVLSFNEGAAE